MELDPDRPSPARVAAVENAIRQAASERLSSNRSTGGGRRTSARTDLVPGLNDSFDNAVEAACLYELQYHRTSTGRSTWSCTPHNSSCFSHVAVCAGSRNQSTNRGTYFRARHFAARVARRALRLALIPTWPRNESARVGRGPQDHPGHLASQSNVGLAMNIYKWPQWTR